MTARPVFHTDREHRQSAGTTHSVGFHRHQLLPAPQHRGEQPSSLETCDEGEEEKSVPRGSFSCEVSTAVSISLKIMFSLNMTDRPQAKMLVKASATLRRTSLQQLTTTMASTAAAEQLQKTSMALNNGSIHSEIIGGIVGSLRKGIIQSCSGNLCTAAKTSISTKQQLLYGP